MDYYPPVRVAYVPFYQADLTSILTNPIGKTGLGVFLHALSLSVSCRECVFNRT